MAEKLPAREVGAALACPMTATIAETATHLHVQRFTFTAANSVYREDRVPGTRACVIHRQCEIGLVTETLLGKSLGSAVLRRCGLPSGLRV